MPCSLPANRLASHLWFSVGGQPSLPLHHCAEDADTHQTCSWRASMLWDRGVASVSPTIVFRDPRRIEHPGGIQANTPKNAVQRTLRILSTNIYGESAQFSRNLHPPWIKSPHDLAPDTRGIRSLSSPPAGRSPATRSVCPMLWKCRNDSLSPR
jgi:hypothetical protein